MSSVEETVAVLDQCTFRCRGLAPFTGADHRVAVCRFGLGDDWRMTRNLRDEYQAGYHFIMVAGPVRE